MITYPELEDVRGFLAAWKLAGGVDAKRVTPDDYLVVAVRNAIAGVQLQLGGRIWHDDGGVNEFQHPIIPASSRGLQFFGLQLEHGYLVEACVTATTGAGHRGQTLATILLVRPPISAFLPKQVLAQDYITTQMGPSWPGGRIASGVEGQGMLYSFTVANPAAGADWIQTVPTGARWRLWATSASLTTSAAVANRSSSLRLDDGVTPLWQAGHNVVQTAGITLLWTFTLGLANLVLASGTASTQPMLPVATLLAGWRIQSFTSSLQAGDQWSAIRLLVEEWLED